MPPSKRPRVDVGLCADILAHQVVSQKIMECLKDSSHHSQLYETCSSLKASLEFAYSVAAEHGFALFKVAPQLRPDPLLCFAALDSVKGIKDINKVKIWWRAVPEEARTVELINAAKRSCSVFFEYFSDMCMTPEEKQSILDSEMCNRRSVCELVAQGELLIRTEDAEQHYRWLLMTKEEIMHQHFEACWRMSRRCEAQDTVCFGR